MLLLLGSESVIAVGRSRGGHEAVLNPAEEDVNAAAVEAEVLLGQLHCRPHQVPCCARSLFRLHRAENTRPASKKLRLPTCRWPPPAVCQGSCGESSFAAVA